MSRSDLDAIAPQIQAGRVVYQLFIGKITRAEAEAQLLALNYLYCEVCGAHMPAGHEPHWSTRPALPQFGLDDAEAYQRLLPKTLGDKNKKLAAQADFSQ